jgi:hypothetical protein
MDEMMKYLISLALIWSSFSYSANSQKEWVPKYKKANLKSTDKKLLQKKDHVVAQKGAKKIIPDTPLEALYLKKPKNKTHLSLLKKESLKLKQKAVPTLIKVMKNSAYPNENRWVATYMLGRIMGKKSAPFISKFTKHPNWMLRLASLKVLLHLDQRQYKGIYARLLEDSSMIVRHQALQNIKILKLEELAPYVWKMLYNKENYSGAKGNRKRSNIIKDAIKVVGDLNFKQAKKPMLQMFKDKKYKDVYEELDYALSRISDKPSPKGSMTMKKHYWSRKALDEVTI